MIFGLSIVFKGSMPVAEKSEYMARYLLSISRYVEWPAHMKTGNFKIGVVGNFSVYKGISMELMGTGIQNRNAEVLNLTKIEQAAITDLSILILTNEYSDAASIAKAIKIIGTKPTLLITEKENALMHGSAINFLETNSKLGFELNKTNASKNGIRISSQVESYALRTIK